MGARTALVTGAGQGIGRAVCRELASAGMRIVALDVDPGSLRELELELASCASGAFFGRVVDVAQPSAVDDALGVLFDNGWTIDVLVPCAAVDPREDPLAIAHASAQRQFDTNFLPLLRLVEALVPGMRQRGFGRVVAIGSIQESRPRRDNLVYAALKAAQTHAVLHWARHSTTPGVTFNVVRPGAIETARNRDVLSDPAYRASILQRIPAGRLGRPEDCAATVAWLCTEAAGYLNGAVIDVDGGMRL
jgi:NAD(P)-dependent dehydrogenase (short-subunit alcohol dehydrogenase family)